MPDVMAVASIGDIEVDIDEASPREIALRLQLMLLDGTEFVLRFENREILQLWDFLSQYVSRNRQHLAFNKNALVPLREETPAHQLEYGPANGERQ